MNEIVIGSLVPVVGDAEDPEVDDSGDVGPKIK